MIFRKNAWPKQIKLLSGTAVLLATIITTASCSAGNEDNAEIQADKTNVTTEDVSGDLDSAYVGTGDPESLIGQSVTVRNSIAEMVGENDFTLQTESGENILVVNTTGQPLSLPSEEVPVQVTGEVARFVWADVESEYGLGLDENTYSGYEDQPAIIANSLAPAPTIEQLVTYDGDFDGQLIALQGDVRGIYSPDTMALFEDGFVDDIGILIVGVESGLKSDQPLQEGETALVVGRAQPFDLDKLQQQYDLGIEQDKLAEFSERYQRSVIVADDVYPSAVEME